MRIEKPMISGSVRRLRALGTIVSKPLVVGDIVGALSCGRLRDARRLAYAASRAPDLGSEKIVSHTYGYLWLSVPKVASRSIIRALRSADPDAEIIAETRIRDVYAMFPDARAYYSFAFVRHPFDRALSFYRELHFAHKIYQGAQRVHKAEKRQKLIDWGLGLGEAHSFDDVCQWLNTRYGSDALADRHYLSQHLQIRLEDGRLPDFIGRFENLEADLNRVAAHLGMPVPPLQRVNAMAERAPAPDVLRTARSAMKAHLTKRNKASLRTRYAEDFALGGYSPD